MKWFSLKGIREEMSKVHWPSVGELTKSSIVVLGFTGAFAVYFLLCELVAAGFFKTLGM